MPHPTWSLSVSCQFHNVVFEASMFIPHNVLLTKPQPSYCCSNVSLWRGRYEHAGVSQQLWVPRAWPPWVGGRTGECAMSRKLVVIGWRRCWWTRISVSPPRGRNTQHACKCAITHDSALRAYDMQNSHLCLCLWSCSDWKISSIVYVASNIFQRHFAEVVLPRDSLLFRMICVALTSLQLYMYMWNQFVLTTHVAAWCIFLPASVCMCVYVQHDNVWNTWPEKLIFCM